MISTPNPFLKALLKSVRPASLSDDVNPVCSWGEKAFLETPEWRAGGGDPGGKLGNSSWVVSRSEEKLSQDSAVSGYKKRHLEVCLTDSGVESPQNNLFSQWSFMNASLPEVNLEDISLETKLLGYSLSMPFFISCMTGGTHRAGFFNEKLAQIAQKCRIPLGIGSFRILFSHPEFFPQFSVRRFAPDIPFFSNLGAVQLLETPFEAIIETHKKMEADALFLHLNSGQELMQAHGSRNFQGIKDAMSRFFEKAPFPVFVKETGAGIQPGETEWLLERGAAAIDLCGAGGTNWLSVENLLQDRQDDYALFESWGTPTALLIAVYEKRGLFKRYPGKIFASGGIRSVLDGAKALNMGAAMIGLALPVLKALEEGEDKLENMLRGYEENLKKIILLCGASSLSSFQDQKRVYWGAEMESRVKNYGEVLERVKGKSEGEDGRSR